MLYENFIEFGFQELARLRITQESINCIKLDSAAEFNPLKYLEQFSYKVKPYEI